MPGRAVGTSGTFGLSVPLTSFPEFLELYLRRQLLRRSDAARDIDGRPCEEVIVLFLNVDVLMSVSRAPSIDRPSLPTTLSIY